MALNLSASVIRAFGTMAKFRNKIVGSWTQNLGGERFPGGPGGPVGLLLLTDREMPIGSGDGLSFDDFRRNIKRDDISTSRLYLPRKNFAFKYFRNFRFGDNKFLHLKWLTL